MKALAILLALVAGCAAGQAAPLPPVHEARRILILGDSVTYSGHYVTCVEAWLTVKHPERGRRVFNLGLPSETVSGLSEENHAGGAFPRPDLHERLERVLQAVRPDLVVACYGINCGIYQPFDEERFKAFREGIGKLRAAVAKYKAPLIHVTPFPYDHLTGRIPVRSYNEAVLAVYTKWLLAQREKGWHVIDLHGAMTAEIAQRRRDDAKFSFQRDGVHPGKEGHWFAAQVLIRAFGDAEAAQAKDVGAMMAGAENGDKILALVQERMVMLRDAWLTQTRHIRPGMKTGLPLTHARHQAAEIEARIVRLQSGAQD